MNFSAKHIAFLILIILVFPGFITAQETYFPGQRVKKNFILGVGSGFGYGNNPCTSCSDKNYIPGIIFSGSLGYRFNNKFKMDFGPSVWIESKALLNSSVPSGEQPKNKRITISFNGYLYPLKNIPVNIKAGLGIGTLIYSTNQKLVATDGKYYNPTEIFNGLSFSGALCYDYRISPVLVFYPSLNFSYTRLQQQKINYTTFIDSKKASVITDLRFNLYFDF